MTNTTDSTSASEITGNFTIEGASWQEVVRNLNNQAANTFINNIKEGNNIEARHQISMYRNMLDIAKDQDPLKVAAENHNYDMVSYLLSVIPQDKIDQMSGWKDLVTKDATLQQIIADGYHDESYTPGADHHKIELSPDIHNKKAFGLAMKQAIQSENIGLCKHLYLVTGHSLSDIRSDNGNTLLHDAYQLREKVIQDGHGAPNMQELLKINQMIEWLYQHEANPDLLNNDGKNALAYTTEYGHLLQLAELSDSSPTNDDIVTPTLPVVDIHDQAMTLNAEQLVDLIHTNQISTNEEFTDQHGEKTSLIKICIDRSAEDPSFTKIAMDLVSSSTSLSSVVNGQEALANYAAEHGNELVAEKIVQQLSPDELNKHFGQNNDTLLLEAIRHGNHDLAEKILTLENVDLAAVDKDGHSAIEVAAIQKDYQLVNDLLSKNILPISSDWSDIVANDEHLQQIMQDTMSPHNTEQQGDAQHTDASIDNSAPIIDHALDVHGGATPNIETDPTNVRFR